MIQRLLREGLLTAYPPDLSGGISDTADPVDLEDNKRVVRAILRLFPDIKVWIRSNQCISLEEEQTLRKGELRCATWCIGAKSLRLPLETRRR